MHGSSSLASSFPHEPERTTRRTRAPCPRIAHRCQSYAFLIQNAGDIPPSMQGARAAGHLLPPHCLMSLSTQHAEYAPPPCPRIAHRYLSSAFLTQNAGDIPPSMQGAPRGWPSPTSSLPHEPEHMPPPSPRIAHRCLLSGFYSIKIYKI
jgi:hypothetical protein